MPGNGPPDTPGDDRERTIVSGSSPGGTGTTDRGWIAGYRVVRKIGEGGMGVVFEAEQQSPRRSVALKVIRGGAYVDEQKVRMFQREVQTLGRLKHAGIAAIYEAGRTDEGQHFFAMELVRGVPLDEYLRGQPRAREGVAARLTLFLQICEAINYAHQRGVMHRDLKPSNILVILPSESATRSTVRLRERVQIKILDFGLARITDADVAAATVITEMGQIAGTLAYMSPEQTRGDPNEIDLRSDVYSLGVMLYEMLTGSRPYQVQRKQLPEAVRVICEEEPQRPSEHVRLLRGDLETIVMKALEKDPARRYQSVLALAEDIERHRVDQPILARPPSATYHLRKLVLRHKGAFASAATLFVLLAAFAVTMAVMFGIQRREKRKAVVEARKVERTNAFLRDMLASVSPEQALGREVTVREVLDEAARDVEAGLADEPEIQAAVRSTIGNTYMALGLYDAAEPHLADALETRESVLGTTHADVASSQGDLGALNWARGEYSEAEHLFQSSLATRRELFGEEHTTIATDLNNLGLLYKTQGRFAEAESLQRAALAMRTRLLGTEHADVAESQHNLATLLERRGKQAEAESLYQEALTTRRAHLGAGHPSVATTLNNLAALQLGRGNYAEADTLFREALVIARKTLGDDHPSVAVNLNNLARVLRAQGKVTEAESLYRDALAIYRQAHGEEHPAIAAILSNLATLLLKQERYAEAEPLYRESLAMRRRLLGDEHPSVANGLQNLAILLHARGAHDEAEPLYREALAMRRRLLGDEHPRVASSLLGLGSLLLDRGQADEAEQLLQRCLTIGRATYPEDHWIIALAESTLGGCWAAQGRYAEAESLLVGSYPTLESSPAVPLRRKREAAARAIDLYERWGRDSEAARYRGALQDLGNKSR